MAGLLTRLKESFFPGTDQGQAEFQLALTEKQADVIAQPLPPVPGADEHPVAMDVIKTFTDAFFLSDSAVIHDYTNTKGRVGTGLTFPNAVVRFVPLEARYDEQQLQDIQKLEIKALSGDGVTGADIANYRVASVRTRPELDEVIAKADELRAQGKAEFGPRYQSADDLHAEHFAALFNSFKQQYVAAIKEGANVPPLSDNRNLAEAKDGNLYINLNDLKYIVENSNTDIGNTLAQAADGYSKEYMLEGVRSNLDAQVDHIKQAQAAGRSLLADVTAEVRKRRTPEEEVLTQGKRSGGFTTLVSSRDDESQTKASAYR